MVEYRKCPKCGKKGFRDLSLIQDLIHLCVTYRTTDVWECKYCSYISKGVKG